MLVLVLYAVCLGPVTVQGTGMLGIQTVDSGVVSFIIANAKFKSIN